MCKCVAYCLISFQVGRTQSILTGGDTGNWDSVGDMEPSSQVSRIQSILTGGDTGNWDSWGDMRSYIHVNSIQSMLTGGETGNWDSVVDMEELHVTLTLFFIKVMALYRAESIERSTSLEKAARRYIFYS